MLRRWRTAAVLPLLLVLLLIGTASAKTLRPLTLTWETESWTWKAGDKHTAKLTVTNNTDGELTGAALNLQPVRVNGAAAEAPVFTALGSKKLKAKEQTASYAIEALPAGESLTLTVVWKPESSLITAAQTALTAELRTADGTAVYSATLREARRQPGSGLPRPREALPLIAALAVLDLGVYALLLAGRRKTA